MCRERDQGNAKQVPQSSTNQTKVAIARWSDSDYLYAVLPPDDPRIGLQLDLDSHEPIDAILPSGHLTFVINKYVHVVLVLCGRTYEGSVLKGTKAEVLDETNGILKSLETDLRNETDAATVQQGLNDIKARIRDFDPETGVLVVFIATEPTMKFTTRTIPWSAILDESETGAA